jgi:hypothetical protein
MANYRAVANGNWNALATWQDDSSGSYVASTVLPGAADTVRFNNFTVIANINATVNIISNASATGVSQGGGISIQNGITITATTQAIAVSDNLFNPSSGAVATFVSPLITSSVPTFISIGQAGSTMNIIGNTSHTGTFSAYRPSGIFNITGNINIASGSGYWIDMINNATCNIIGNLTTVFNGFWVRGFCLINLTGSLTSGSQGAYVNTNLNITFTHFGPVNVGGNAAAIVDTFGIYAGTGPFFNNGDFAAVAASRFRLINTSPTSMRLWTGAANRTLYTEDSVGGVPATSNVRSGTVYGIGGTLTGTLAVPSPSNVRQGVPTDNTVGTAALTPADFWNYLTSSATPGSMGARVAAIPTNPASVESTGAQIASFNT